MSSRQSPQCLHEAPIQASACLCEHSPTRHSKARSRAVAGTFHSTEVDPELKADGIRIPRSRFHDTRLPLLSRPLKFSSLPPDTLPLSGPELTPAPVDSPTAQFTQVLPVVVCERHPNSEMLSSAVRLAGRDSITAAGSRLWGELGFLAMEEDQLESLGQPPPPASVHAAEDDLSPEIHASGPPHKTAGVARALESMDDLQLVSAAQSGEATAFDLLMLRHTSKLYGLVFHMSSSHEDTDDLLQEIWAKVYRSLPSFRGASRFSTWVHSIAVNMTLNFLKKRNRRSPISINATPEGSDATLADLPGIDAELEDALVCNQTPRTDANRGELQKLLSDALDELTPEHRAVVTMFDVQGMAHAEIAKVMGISEGTVRSRLFYAHRQLQSYLSDVASDFLQTPNKNAL